MNAPKTRTQTAGIVLAGTHPWTNSAFDKLPPRALLPIAHRPLISYALSWLEDGGIHQVAVCANRETQTLQSFECFGSEMSRGSFTLEPGWDRSRSGCGFDADRRLR